ncbi:hypothetical protein IV203_015319 [Nitzschia inconspicua]|uniref:Uncharacterized protein n=1 Tax=Nitzschia inconspicua TaxID=303405 RepID=A0A9K3LAD6_9STRA|nr:hypothetical protein IV203_015319 [Nitzschia inconspicua]
MMKSISLLFLLPAQICGHGCSFFRLADDDLRERFMNEELVPTSIKDYVTSLGAGAIPFGVYDCHDGIDDYEVGYSAACTDDGNCKCTALYNFNECRACELTCGADITNLDKGSFQADCSNVKSDISETCSVSCNYATYDCFPGDPSLPKASGAWIPLSTSFMASTMVLLVLIDPHR